MTRKLLIYGAYGYSGRLAAELASSRGMNPIVAGRNAHKTEQVGQALGAETRVFSLDNPEQVDRALRDVDVVLHCAGPFARTSRAMFEACVRTRTHYLDITGEASVFESLAARSSKAREAGIMVMPGTGFDVVPSDCLAMHLKEAMPEATWLDLAFQGSGGLSHGTATTMVENLHQGSAVRRGGKLVQIASGTMTRNIDFGRGKRSAMAIPWGDISTAWTSTGIPNITVFVAAPPQAIRTSRIMGKMPWLVGSSPVQRLLKTWIDSRPAGPDADTRQKGYMRLWGQARDAGGKCITARLKTPEGYTLTAMASVEIAHKVLQGDAPVGYQTPSMAYGADFILGFEGVEREDAK